MKLFFYRKKLKIIKVKGLKKRKLKKNKKVKIIKIKGLKKRN